jgi:ABC-type lipoprotein release transport system permease subunit
MTACSSKQRRFNPGPPLVFWRLLVYQARYRLGAALLVFLAIAALVTLYVYVSNTAKFTNRSMQLIMKNLGHNMLILPEDGNPLDVYLCTGQEKTFSDEVTRTLAQNTGLFSRYYVSVLQKTIVLDGVRCILTGIEPVKRSDETSEKGNMIAPLRPGGARLGAAAAARLNLKQGDPLPVRDATFQVTEIREAEGTQDDYRIYLNLPDCQRLLNMPGMINVIWAFACLHHGGPLEEIEAIQARKLAAAAPGFRHISRMPIARGRYLARETTSNTLYYLLGIVLAVTILIITITGMQEVAERRRETGILVAMGTGFACIVGLYLVKLLALAVAASLTGFVLGSVLAIDITSRFLVTNTQSVTILWSHLPPVMFQSCLVALIGMLLPVIHLLRMDPNTTLAGD